MLLISRLMGHSIDHYPGFHILRLSKNSIPVLDHDNFTRNTHLYRRPTSLTVMAQFLSGEIINVPLLALD